MTEKRFTAIRKRNPVTKDIGNYIQDNGTTILKLGFSQDCKDVAELLNMLHEENEEIGTALDNMVTFKNKYRDKYKEVKKENEQLKQELADVDRLIDDLGHDEMRRQYEEIFKGDVE